MKALLIVLLSAVTFTCPAQRKYYGGGRHTTSHGGYYKGGAGASHKGGHYKLAATHNHYGRHK